MTTGGSGSGADFADRGDDHGDDHVGDLQTSRLLLRPFTLALARAVLTGEVPVDQSWAEGYPMADEVGLLRLVLDAGTEPRGWGPWQLLDTRHGRRHAVGGIGFLGHPDELGEVEVGFGLVRPSRGAGLASEALLALVGWATAHGARIVYGTTTATNPASQRTMINAGLRPQTTAPGDGSVLLSYAIVARRPAG